MTQGSRPRPYAQLLWETQVTLSRLYDGSAQSLLLPWWHLPAWQPTCPALSAISIIASCTRTPPSMYITTNQQVVVTDMLLLSFYVLSAYASKSPEALVVKWHRVRRGVHRLPKLVLQPTQLLWWERRRLPLRVASEGLLWWVPQQGIGTPWCNFYQH